MTIGYSDTFLSSQRCHFKRGRLYLNFFFSYSPVTTQAAAYFNTTLSGIDLLITAPNLIGMPLSLMSTWIIDKIGLRKTILASSGLVCSGAFIKCLVTFPGLDQHFDQKVQYWMTLCGQFLVGPGNVLAFCIPNKAWHIYTRSEQ